MSGRTVRARPVDVHKQLDIVKDPSLLDSLEGLPTVPVPTAPEPEKVCACYQCSCDAIVLFILD